VAEILKETLYHRRTQSEEMKPRINTDKHGNPFSPKNLLRLSAFICGSFFLLCGCIKGPDFPYYASPRVTTHTPENPASANIAITFQLIDREKEPANIILEYSTNGGATFNPATLVDSSETQNLESDWYPGIIHTVRWDSVTNMVGISGNASVIVKVTPYDATNPSGGTSDVSRNFTVNNIEFNQPPSVSITTPSGVQLGNIPINYSLSDIESDTCSIMVEYSTDGGENWQSATMGWAGDGLTDLSSLPPGTAHMFLWNSREDGVGVLAAQDNVMIRITPSDFHTGNPAETANFSVDNSIANIPPTVNITSGPEEGSTVQTNQVTFTWTGSDADGMVIGYYYSFDRDRPNIWTTGNSGSSGVLADGLHTFRVVAIDDGNALSPVASRAFIVAYNSPPTVTITSGPEGTIDYNNPTFTWRGSDADGVVVGYYYAMDNPEPSNWTTGTSYTAHRLSNGLHTFYVRAQDNKDTLSEVAQRSFSVDVSGPNEIPTVEILSGPEGRTSSTAVTFTYIGSDSDGTISGYWVGIDTDPPVIWHTGTSWTSPVLSDGPHTFFVVAEDNRGGMSTPASRSFVVDRSGSTAPFNFSFAAADVAFDERRFCIYATDYSANRTVKISALTGSIIAEVTHGYPPESLVMSPDGTKLYVSLLISGHNYSGGDGNGQVAIVDLNTFTKTGVFDTTVDPYDIVATDTGFVVVSSGSGQWTSIHSYNSATGARVGSAGIRHQCHLDIHPDQSQIYYANTDLSPSDIGKYVLSESGALTGMGDSPYHGDHRMAGNVWVSPTGDFVVTRGGDLFTSSPVHSNDMLYIMSLSNTTSLSDCFFYLRQGVMITVEGNSVCYYDFETMTKVRTKMLGGNGRDVSVMGGEVFVTRFPTANTMVIDHF
jgi:hypothetical protein